MTLLLFLVAGLVLGVVAERLVGPPRSAQDRAVGIDSAGRPRARRRRRPGRILAWTALTVVVLLLAGLVGGYLWANSVFNKIEKVDVSGQLSSSSGGTNYLLVGSDGVGADGQAREGVDGRRSDTIMVLRVEGSSAKMLSLNRDLWVNNPATGQQGRLNATYNDGPGNLISAVTENFGIPIERYLEVDFNSFGRLVDEFGGIDVTFEHSAFDLGSGLDVPAGLVHLDGNQALAYVRSRHYYERIDGKNVPEGGLPDVNRTMRQQVFLREIMKKAGSKRNPLALMGAADAMSAGLRIDDDMTMLDAARFAWTMGKLDPQPLALTVIPVRKGNAAVLEIDPGPSEPVLAQFR